MHPTWVNTSMIDELRSNQTIHPEDVASAIVNHCFVRRGRRSLYHPTGTGRPEQKTMDGKDDYVEDLVWFLELPWASRNKNVT